MLFAWTVGRRVRSNAIVIAKDGATLGIGAGQMSRVDSVRLAVEKCREARGEEADALLAGSALASDAFFPFADGPELAIQAGANAVIQPGGSKRDAEVIEACDAGRRRDGLHQAPPLPALAGSTSRLMTVTKPLDCVRRHTCAISHIASPRRGRGNAPAAGRGPRPHEAGLAGSTPARGATMKQREGGVVSSAAVLVSQTARFGGPFAFWEVTISRVPPAGLEPAPRGLKGRRSNQLSYRGAALMVERAS